MLEAQTNLFQRVAAYARGFAGDFRRRDQARWLEIYLHGLLSVAERKNVETLARQGRWLSGRGVEDPAQALQNFINQSTWDERKVLRRYRQHVARHLGSPAGTFIIHDVGFPKQGRQSVGVLRQFCPELQRKLNCQLAVAVSYLSPAGVCPLGLRLYLPRPWLSDPARLTAAGVAPEHRLGLSKQQIALQLLEEILDDGVPGSQVVAATHGGSAELRGQLTDLGLSYVLGVSDEQLVLSAAAMLPGGYFTRIGQNARPLPVRELARQTPLAALPGEAAGQARTTRCGWVPVWPELQHDGTPVPGTRPVRLLIQEQDGLSSHALAELPDDTACATAVRLWQQRHDGAALYGRLRHELGLDHFEGRSWRGFHHHVCLVMAAYGFQVHPTLPADFTGSAVTASTLPFPRAQVQTAAAH